MRNSTEGEISTGSKSRFFGTQMYLGILWMSLISGFSLSLSDVADAIVVGKRVGELGLAAVGIVTPLYMIYNIIGYGFSIGASVAHARLTSAGKEKEAREQFAASALMMIVVGLAIGSFGNLFNYGLIGLLGAPEDEAALRELCSQYSRPLLIFAPVMLVNYLFYDILRSDDDTRLATISFAGGCIIDLGLNILFVLVLDLGVAGAGWATALSQTVSVLVGLRHFFNDRGCLKLIPLREVKFGMMLDSWKLFLSGFSTSVRYVYQFLFLLVANRLLLHAAGIDNTLYMAVFDVVLNVSYVAYSMFEASGEAMRPVAATFYEERDRGGLFLVRRLALLCGCGFGLLVVALCALFAPQVSRLFGVNTPEALAVAVPAIRVFCLAPLFGGMLIILIAFYQSIEMEKTAALYTSLRSFLVLLPVTVFFGLFQVEHFFWLFPVTEAVCWIVALLHGRRVDRARILRNVVVYSYTMENNHHDIGELLGGLAAFCEEHGATVAQANLVNLVIEEICVEIVSTAFTGKAREYIQVTLSKEPDGSFIMHQRYSAERYNPFEELRGESKEAEDLLDSLGVILVKKKAKDFFYRRYEGFNLLTVVL